MVRYIYLHLYEFNEMIQHAIATNATPTSLYISRLDSTVSERSRTNSLKVVPVQSSISADWHERRTGIYPLNSVRRSGCSNLSLYSIKLKRLLLTCICLKYGEILGKPVSINNGCIGCILIFEFPITVKFIVKFKLLFKFN